MIEPVDENRCQGCVRAVLRLVGAIFLEAGQADPEPFKQALATRWSWPFDMLSSFQLFSAQPLPIVQLNSGNKQGELRVICDPEALSPALFKVTSATGLVIVAVLLSIADISRGVSLKTCKVSPLIMGALQTLTDGAKGCIPTPASRIP